jgi:hypothetical protein
MNSRIELLNYLLKGPIWDGNLPSKHDRDELCKAGLIARCEGFNFLTAEGVRYCVNLNLLSA